MANRPNLRHPSNPLIIPSPNDLLPNTSQDPAAAAAAASPSGRHPVYRGIRFRSGKWVSEIRKPLKATRIWLGTYPTQEMAAAAYDVASLALKGPETLMNFANLVSTYPVPTSQSSSDIRLAAAAMAPPPPPPQEGSNQAARQQETHSRNEVVRPLRSEFVDDEELLNMPKLLVDMAEAMLMSPPRMKPTREDDSAEDSENASLWSY